MTRTLRREVVLAASLFLSAIVGACGSSDSTTTTTPTTPSPTVTSVAVTGQTPNVGLTSQFTSTATLSNGTTQNVTSQATWQSSNAAIATVSNAGVVTAVAPGEVDITATYQSVAGRARITIAQSTFAIRGVVTDATSGGILPNIDLQITAGPNTGLATKTDSAGAYTLSGVLAGTQTVSASAVSYVTQAKNVTVVSSNATLDFVLVRTPGCVYTLPVTSQNVPAAGGNFSFNATSADSCNWTASTSTPWITLGTTSGTSPATVTFAVAANSAISPRTGSIRLSWSAGFADYTVTQGAGDCTFSLNPTSGSITAAGGTGSFVVTPSDSACGWTATSDSSWLSITGGASGTGVGTISYSAQPYAGPTGPRIGNIAVTGTVSGVRSFPVQQQPPP
jgi:Carboxypeptidase regulatory-like domain/Bacterial Ig-like domain (group 2)/Putative binding domain, N-terminal